MLEFFVFLTALINGRVAESPEEEHHHGNPVCW